MAKKLGLTILIGIILTILIISVVNVGTSLFIERPDYPDCWENNRELMPIIENQDNVVCTEDAKLCGDGSYVSRNEKLNCNFNPCPNELKDCQDEWDKANENYNQIKFYIFAIVGFILLLIGLFQKELLIQITGLSTGGILVLEGVVTNLENKLVAFITLLLILTVFGVLGYRLIKKS